MQKNKRKNNAIIKNIAFGTLLFCFVFLFVVLLHTITVVFSWPSRTVMGFSVISVIDPTCLSLGIASTSVCFLMPVWTVQRGLSLRVGRLHGSCRRRSCARSFFWCLRRLVPGRWSLGAARGYSVAMCACFTYFTRSSRAVICSIYILGISFAHFISNLVPQPIAA